MKIQNVVQNDDLAVFDGRPTATVRFIVYYDDKTFPEMELRGCNVKFQR